MVATGAAIVIGEKRRFTTRLIFNFKSLAYREECNCGTKESVRAE